MIVMKFGGTSVQDAQAIDRVAAIVRERLHERPVVVVSALAKITDQLLAMAAAAGAGDRKKALELSQAAASGITAALPIFWAMICWASRRLRRSRRSWKPTSTAWTSFCAALSPWANSRREPLTPFPVLASVSLQNCGCRIFPAQH